MLVYANEIFIQPSEHALADAKKGIKTWLDRKIGRPFSTVKIIPFAENFVSHHPETGANEASIIGTPDHAPDYCLSINYRHNDATVSGRAWFTRIGMERPSPEAPLRITILLETSEVSPQVALNPVRPSMPGIVHSLLKTCTLDPSTPSHSIFRLEPHNVQLYRERVESKARHHPIIVVSPDDFSEETLVDPEKLRERLVGLAQIFVIANKTDSRKLRTELPSFYTAWDGAITVVSPYREGRAMGRVYKNSEIEALCHESGKTFEQWLFEEITHRNNLPKSLRHIGHDLVGRRLISFKIRNLREQSRSAEGLDEIVESYENDRLAAQKQAEDLEYRLLQLEDSNSELREKIHELEKQIRTKDFQIRRLESASSPEPTQADQRPPAPEEMAGFPAALAMHYRDQIVLTNHAESTLKKSDFEKVDEAWQAFQILASHFHPAMANGERIQEAIEQVQSIPARYSGNNSEVTAGKCDGYERMHEGRKYTLNKHIAIGNARDPRYCFRLYFEWEPEIGKIIVLHAGPHLQTQSS